MTQLLSFAAAVDDMHYLITQMLGVLHSGSGG